MLTTPIVLEGVPLYHNIAVVGSYIAEAVYLSKIDAMKRLKKLYQRDRPSVLATDEFKRYLSLHTQFSNCLGRQLARIIEPTTGEAHENRHPDTFLMADVLAVNSTLQVFDEVREGTKNRMKLPDSMLRYTATQIFFIRYAQKRCANLPADYIRELMAIIPGDMRSKKLYGYFRALVPLMNSPQFAQSFNCTLGSRMNPQDKCVAW